MAWRCQRLWCRRPWQRKIHRNTLCWFFTRAQGKNQAHGWPAIVAKGLFHGKIECPVVLPSSATSPNQPKANNRFWHLTKLKPCSTKWGTPHTAFAGQGTYASQTGTNVLWDFVELPSQLQENWLYEPETLTAAPILETGNSRVNWKIAPCQNFVGWNGVRQMLFPLWIWNGICAILKPLPILWLSRMKSWKTAAFSHVWEHNPILSTIFFAGGYSAGYYSYKWASPWRRYLRGILETGLYNQDTAHRYCTEILEKRGSEHPAVLLSQFPWPQRRPESSAPWRIIKITGYPLSNPSLPDLFGQSNIFLSPRTQQNKEIMAKNKCFIFFIFFLPTFLLSLYNKLG